ncbi:MAG: GRP family sugar transporter [Chitinispirillales bacterium]|jgi:glucose uptake protein GlcU|nr:GRP family sugar transporter [Chitinispirillales bacterium]
MISGFILSVLVSLLFAVYAIPRKFSTQNVILYTMWMGVAYFVGTAAAVPALWGGGFERAENLASPWHSLTVARGGVWVLGMAMYNLAIDKIGLTRFNQWKNVQGPVGSLLILFVVSENVTGTKVLFLALGMTVMLLSAMFFQIRLETDRGKTAARSGVLCALGAGVCFGVAALLNSVVSSVKITGERFILSQLLYHSASLVVISALTYIILGGKLGGESGAKERFFEVFKVDKKTYLPFIAGGMYMLAAFLTIYSYRLIPNNAVPWSITQLNVFWTILAGVFIFKEIDFKKHFLRLAIGTVAAIVACALLFFAM